MTARKNRTHLVIITLSILILGALLFLIYQQLTTARALRDDIAEKEQMVAQAEARLATLKELSLKEDEMREELAHLEGLMPSLPLENQVIRQFQAAADEAEIEMIAVRFADRVNGEDFVEMPLNLTFEGRYRQLRMLLSELEKTERAVRVDDIRMGAGREELPWLQVDIRGSVFYAGQ